MATTSLVEDALAGPTVFKDVSTLSFDYVPQELPHRDDVIRRLAQMFRGVAEGQASQMATVQGPVGSGKTAIAKRFTEDLREAMRKRKIELRVAYVNCRNDRSDAMALTTVLRTLDKGFPDRGFAMNEMLDALAKRIEKNNIQLIIILDEIDVLFRETGGKQEKSELVYALSRFDVPGRPAALSVIAISQHDIFQKLDEASASTFKQANILTLEGYGHEAMRTIVDQRVGLAFHKGTVGDRVAELVSDIATSDTAKGNARLAIEILAAAGTNADDRASETVTAEDVRTARASRFSALPQQKLKELPLHEMVVLLALARRLAKSDDPYAVTSELESTYQVICESVDEKPRGHTQFWSYLKNLESYGFIQLKKSGAGHAGTTHLISLPDVPAGELKETLAGLMEEVHEKAA